jgi:hypothetical protein
MTRGHDRIMFLVIIMTGLHIIYILLTTLMGPVKSLVNDIFLQE